MKREVIQFGHYEFAIGDTLKLSDRLDIVKIVDITKDRGKVYVILKYGKNNPVLIEARKFAYYIMNNVYQPTVTPKYKQGQRFVHQYNNNTVYILAVSPAVASDNNEYVYFSALVSEDGTFAYISVGESYFDRLIELEPVEDEFPQPPIPENARLPEVTMYIKPPEHSHHYPPHPPHHSHHHCPPPPIIVLPPTTCEPGTNPGQGGSTGGTINENDTVIQILDDNGQVIDIQPFNYNL